MHTLVVAARGWRPPSRVAAALGLQGRAQVIGIAVVGPRPRRQWWWPRHISRWPLPRGRGRQGPRLRGGRRGREGTMAAAPRAHGDGLRVGQRLPGVLRSAPACGAHLWRRRAGSTFLQGEAASRRSRSKLGSTPSTNGAEEIGVK
jgi:hypothetical protein